MPSPSTFPNMGGGVELHKNYPLTRKVAYDTVPDTAADGYASINRMKGAAVKMNQIINGGNFSDPSLWACPFPSTITVGMAHVIAKTSSATSVVNLGSVGTKTYQANHKYLCIIQVKKVFGAISIMPTNTAADGAMPYTSDVSTTNFQRLSWIFAPTVEKAGFFTIRLYSNNVEGTPEYYVNLAICFDLTAMFGSGREPTTADAFAQALGYKNANYLPSYIPPSVEPVIYPLKKIELESRGFNIWDEKWELGQYNTSGAKVDTSVNIRSQNYIPVLPSVTYYITSEKYNVTFYVCYYDKNKTCLRRFDVTDSGFTTSSDCYYITFCSVTTYYGTSYDYGININIFSTLNGQYRPYRQPSRVYFDVTKLKGKAIGSDEEVTIFPNGMLSALDAFDEIYEDCGELYAVKRIGYVPNMANLNYSYVETYDCFYAGLANYGSPAQAFKATCSRYPYYGPYSNFQNKSCGYIYYYNIAVRDSAYTTPTEFKNSLNGVELYYELATPIVYKVTNRKHVLTYKVEGGGQELVSSADGAPVMYVGGEWEYYRRR